MLGRFQENKLLQLFAKLDRTGDGFIEYVDFIACYEVLRAATGWEPDHPDGNRLLRTSRALWDQLCGTMDYNGDGRISSQEWVTFFNILHDRVRGQQLPEWFPLTARLFYGWLDLDGNGEVTREEYLFYLKSIGAEPAEGAFEALAGERGTLSEESFLTAFRELLFNMNPEDPTNYVLMGKFPYVRPAEIEKR